MKSLLLSLTLLTFATATTMAGVIETAADRSTFANSDDSLGTSNTDSDSTLAYGDWLSDLSVDSYAGGPSGGFSSSYQDSTIAPGAYSGVIYNYLAADPQGDIFNLPSSYASSEFIVDFTLDSTETFTLSGWVNPYRDDSGVNSDISVSIINTGVGGSPTQVIANESDDAFTAFDVTDTLLPGDYRLEVSTVVSAQATFIDYYISGGADTSFDMTITPEPASLSLLALGGLVCLRRRR